MTKWKIQDTEKLHRARPVDEEKKKLIIDIHVHVFTFANIFFF